MSAKNKKISLLITIFFLALFSLSVFAEESFAEDYAPCGDDLDCHATTVGATCSLGEAKCVSEGEDFGFKADKVNGHSLVCCKASGYSNIIDKKHPAGVCKLVERGYYKTPSCTEPPTPIPTQAPVQAQSETECEIAGGLCVPTFPCVPGFQPDLSLSCGDSGVCCAPILDPECAPYFTFISGKCTGDKSYEKTYHDGKCGTFTSSVTCGDSLSCAIEKNSPTCITTNQLVWQQIAFCPVSTPIPTLPPNLFSCVNQTGPAVGNYQCADIINGAVQCQPGYGVYTPEAPYTGTSCETNKKGCCKQGSTPQPNLFSCQNQVGTYAGEYTCADIVNGTTQCPDGYSKYNESAPYTGTVCGVTRGCCKKDALIPTPTKAPTPTLSSAGLCTGDNGNQKFQCYPNGCPQALGSICVPPSLQGVGYPSCPDRTQYCHITQLPSPTPGPTGIPTATPKPTSPPASVTLAMSINAQDVPLVEESLDVNLSLYNLTTNSPVSGLGSKSFTKTPIPGKQYAANISLTNLTSDKYFVVARKDKMLAKSVFTVTSATGTITVPTTTLVFGDLNNDNDINVLDHENKFKGCWKKAPIGDCLSSDFDKNGKIDQIDYNTFLRGLATWDKQGKNL